MCKKSQMKTKFELFSLTFLLDRNIFKMTLLISLELSFILSKTFWVSKAYENFTFSVKWYFPLKLAIIFIFICILWVKVRRNNSSIVYASNELGNQSPSSSTIVGGELSFFN